MADGGDEAPARMPAARIDKKRRAGQDGPPRTGGLPCLRGAARSSCEGGLAFACANAAAAGTPISVTAEAERILSFINQTVRQFVYILDRLGRRQYVARALEGQVDFASISSDGFFRRAVRAPLASDKAPEALLGPHIPCEGPMAERDEGEEELQARLERLGAALGKRRKEATPRPDAADGGFGSAMGLGFRAASEFAASVGVGGFIGYWLDVWLGTKPAFLIIFFMLGFASGVWSVVRVTSPTPRKGPTKVGTRVVEAAPPPAEQSAPAGADEDED
jgi:ATP synthase protein I